MHEREHERKQQVDHDAYDVVTPGRASASAALVRSAHATASGLLLRKGAGEMGADAETAVAQASSSGGQSLPGELRERFEGSLGVDLSAVRVHTGAESQDAARAVSARAYAVGNDIHFGAGNYNPTSTDGQHLLAHEVAHTVQQRGGATTRQHKLEVSRAGDTHEVEADRAADAMVTGAPAQVSAIGGGVVQRDQDRNPLTGEPALPRPLYWDGMVIDGDIETTWSGAPQFSKIAIGGMDRAGVDWVNRVEKYKLAFNTAWFSGQAAWNGAVPAMRDYKDAAQDAENKGLADFGGKGSDIDVDAETEDFGGKTKVTDAYTQDSSKLEAGGKTFDRAKVDEDLKRTIIDQKRAIATAGRAVDGSERGIDDAKIDLENSKLELENAVLGLKAKEDAKDIKACQTQIEAYKRSMAMMSTAIGGMMKMTKGAEGAAEAGEVGLQMLNTHLWETSILKVEGQIQVLEGATMQGEIIGADNMKKIAANNVRKAVNRVRTAIDDYKTKCGEWKKAYADLAGSLEKAAVQSSGNPKMGAKVRAAVEAIPLMQLTLEKCRALQAKTHPVPENRDATIGGGMCSNGTDFTNRMGILASWQQEMALASQKWQKRLTLAKQLCDQAQ